jgi:hypothetical protein
MPYDPDWPPSHADLTSPAFRAQFQGLKTLIDAVPAGPEGPPGPPFADAVVDGVTTLEPGEPATVEATFDGTDVHLTFGIPRGNDGGTGSDGPVGPPGEVTSQQLTDAIATTAWNPPAIGPFGGSFSDPPTQAEMMDFAAYVESFRLALTR